MTRTTLVLALTLLAHNAMAAPADKEQAMAAYDAKQFARCAQMFTAQAAAAKGEAAGDPLYMAGCCYALDGKIDQAFAALERSIVAALPNVAHLQVDTDLVSLRADARWPKLIASAQSRIAVWEKSLGDPALRRELLAMVKEDQDARSAIIKSGDLVDKALSARVQTIDRKNTARMKQIIAEHGWPGSSLVGKDGAGDAWLLVQHADRDLAFQKLCLGKLEAAVKSGEAAAKHYAYLVDRVAAAEKRKQVYGTQFDEHNEPLPIEDEAHVEERRKAIGLGSLADYKKEMLRMYGPAR